MIEAIIKNRSYIIILALWSIVGMISLPLSLVVILVTLILFFNKQRYYEALFGFFFLLVLSDSLEELFQFAKFVKPYYLLTMGALCFVDPNFKFIDFKLFKRLFLFFVICLISTIYSPVPTIALEKIVSYSLLLVVVPNIILFEYKKIKEYIFINLIAFSFIIHLISISILITFPEVGISHGDRWRGVFGNPNGLGLYLVVNYMLYRIITSKFKLIFTRLDHFLYLGVTLVFIWMTGSRNAISSVIIFELIANGFKYSKPITILIFITLLIYFDLIFEFFINILSFLGMGESLRLENIEEGSGRYIAWAYTWKEINNGNLILGRGMGYDEFYMRANYKLLSSLGHEGGVHNTYLIIWINSGIIGLLAFFMAYISFFIETYKRNRFVIPTLITILSSIFYEPWLSASLNPYTSICLVIITFFIYVEKENT